MLSRVRTTAAHCSENVTSMILWALLALLQPHGKTQYTLPQTTNLPESIPIHSFIRPTTIKASILKSKNITT